MKPLTIVSLVLALLVAAVLGLFGFQNLMTRVDLVFALPLAGGWYLVRDFPVPYLLGITFLAGFLIAFLWFGVRAMSAGRRASSLHKQVESLQDELQWAKRSGNRAASTPVSSGGASPSPAARPAIAVGAPAPKPAPKKEAPAAADPPDFDDLI